MADFMLAYHGANQPASKEEGMAQREKWMAWIESLGDAIVNPGTPLPDSRLVTTDRVAEDSNPDAMMGFAIVKADDMAAAVKIAQSDPFLNMGGTIRVSEMMEME